MRSPKKVSYILSICKWKFIKSIYLIICVYIIIVYTLIVLTKFPFFLTNGNGFIAVIFL